MDACGVLLLVLLVGGILVLLNKFVFGIWNKGGFTKSPAGGYRESHPNVGDTRIKEGYLRKKKTAKNENTGHWETRWKENARWEEKCDLAYYNEYPTKVWEASRWLDEEDK